MFFHAKTIPPKKIWVYTILIATIFLTLSAPGASLSIGTAPGVLDLGTVQPGEDIDFKFYLVSNTPGDILVDLSPMKPHLTLFLTNQTGRYKFIPEYASNKEVEGWVSLKRSPVLVSPSKTMLIKLSDGSVIRANGEAEVTVHVPKDAEPCYYISSINPSPIVTPSVGATGVATIGVTRFVFVFKVAGDASRDGEVVDIMPFRESKNTARFDVLFRNSGTCSIFAWLENLTIYSSNGTRMADLMSGGTVVSPGQIGVLLTRWSDDKISEGNYRAEARVQYYTGSAFYEKTVTILRPPAIPTGRGAQPEAKCSYPWWILILLFAVLLFFYVLNRASALIVRIAIILMVLVALIGILTCFSSVPWTWFLLGAILILLYVYLKG